MVPEGVAMRHAELVTKRHSATASLVKILATSITENAAMSLAKHATSQTIALPA